MASGSKGKETKFTEEDVVRLEEDEIVEPQEHSLCLMGKVLTSKPFNAFGFLETMKKAMKTTKGFTAKEVGNNLFSFKFQSRKDLQDILAREPWHFEKKLLILKEIERGVQPSKIKFESVGMWIRLYDLPQSVRSERCIRKIVAQCGEIIEIDRQSMEGFGRSIRIKVMVDVSKPLKQGMKVEQMNSPPVWIPFKYEHLPSFCYLCGSLEHMRRECDLTEDMDDLLRLPDSKLPYGEWMRASPYKKASVSTEHARPEKGEWTLRRRLFEDFKRKVKSESLGEKDEESPKGKEDDTIEGMVVDNLRKNLELVNMVERDMNTERNVKLEMVKIEENPTFIEEEMQVENIECCKTHVTPIHTAAPPQLSHHTPTPLPHLNDNLHPIKEANPPPINLPTSHANNHTNHHYLTPTSELIKLCQKQMLIPTSKIENSYHKIPHTTLPQQTPTTKCTHEMTSAPTTPPLFLNHTNLDSPKSTTTELNTPIEKHPPMQPRRISIVKKPETVGNQNQRKPRMTQLARKRKEVDGNFELNRTKRGKLGEDNESTAAAVEQPRRSQ